MRHQKLYKPASVTGWAVVVYDNRNIQQPEVDYIVHELKEQADRLGFKEFSSDPPVSFPPVQALDVHKHLQAAGAQVFQQTKAPPNLIVVVLPEYAADLYQAVKHFGDVKQGVATQCLVGIKVKRGGARYYTNVLLKINAKLGGINTILDPTTHEFLSDVTNPIMILGSKVMHPAPGAYGRPSFPAVVGSLDSHATRYAAVSGPQESRVGMIMNLENMIYELISRHAWWKAHQEYQELIYPKRLVFYRSGVSEGQFAHVLQYELSAIKAACKRHNINPTITILVVGRRHHVRFFPTHGMEDQSGNCPLGTVVDDVVGHSTEFDFYLQSHSVSGGTARSAHYSVLYDENKFTQDSLQTLTFALCHLNARTTRSMSIPAPLHYADTVTWRVRFHFDPSVNYISIDDEAFTSEGSFPAVEGSPSTIGRASSILERYKSLYQPLHDSMRYMMFFM